MIPSWCNFCGMLSIIRHKELMNDIKLMPVLWNVIHYKAQGADDTKFVLRFLWNVIHYNKAQGAYDIELIFRSTGHRQPLSMANHPAKNMESQPAMGKTFRFGQI